MEPGAELQESLALLEHSQELLRVILLGLALQYRSLDLQRCELLAAENPETPYAGLDPIQVQSAASLIVLCALFGFQKQAEDLASEAVREGLRLDLLDVKLGAAAILIALIRLVRLNLPGGAPAQEPLPAPAAEEEEEAADLPL